MMPRKKRMVFLGGINSPNIINYFDCNRVFVSKNRFIKTKRKIICKISDAKL